MLRVSAPEKLREAVEAIDAEGLSQDRLRALTVALVEVRRVTPQGEMAAMLRRHKLSSRPFVVPAGSTGRGRTSPVAQARKQIAKFLVGEFEGQAGISKRSVATFLNIEEGSLIFDFKSDRAARTGGSLSAELERARPGAAVQKKPVPTEIRHTVSATAAPNIDGALSLTLKAIGESGDLRKYGGLVREIGKVLA